MSNDVLISVPLFLFMGYMIERSNILDRLFFSLQVGLRRLPGSMALAALITCTLFATATGIVGAVVTLMGLLALPAMLKAGYDQKLASGVITAGGTLGILIPPSIMLIVYAATAGISVVKLYAAAIGPGLLLACLYLIYVFMKVFLTVFYFNNSSTIIIMYITATKAATATATITIFTIIKRTACTLHMTSF